MIGLNEAYKIIDIIPLDADKKLVFKMADEAFKKSPLCFEAAKIMSIYLDSLEDKEKVLLENINSLKDYLKNQNAEDLIRNNLNKANYELGSLYYEHGLFKKALSIFRNIKDENTLIKYKLMVIYALLEDKEIEDYYNELLNSNLDEIEFVRISFTYMIYLYKKNSLTEAKLLFKEINQLNSNIKKALNGEDVNDEETYKILKNNSLLINSCPYIIRDLVI